MSSIRKDPATGKVRPSSLKIGEYYRFTFKVMEQSDPIVRTGKILKMLVPELDAENQMSSFARDEWLDSIKPTLYIDFSTYMGPSIIVYVEIDDVINCEELDEAQRNVFINAK